jgi:NAD(P)-dependent dehydrogenase (short-subunit alcohol dehydrogenase family)
MNEQQAGTFFVVQLAIRQMLSQRREGVEQRGSIVMVASASASGSCPGHKLTAYGGSKGFVKSFALQLGHEMAMSGIRVNSISPGYVEIVQSTFQRRFSDHHGQVY